MTTSTPYHFTAAYDPSGAELRRELLLPARTPTHSLRTYRGPLVVGATEALTLMVGFLRVAFG